MKKLIITLLLIVAVCQISLACPLCKKDSAELVIILDRSGSMENMKVDMEKALRKFLKDQRKSAPNLRCTLVKFDDQYEVEYRRRSIQKVDNIIIEPRGWTALLDAIGKTVNSTARRSNSNKVIFVIITDGLENASKKYERDDIFKSIKHMRKTHNWEFIYLGANQDAIAVGSSYGIDYNWIFDSDNMLSIVDCASTLTSAYIEDEPNIE